MVDFQAGLAGLKGTLDMVKGAYALKSEVERNIAISDVQRNLVEAYETYFSALRRMDELEQEVVRLKDWSAEKQRYELKRYHPGSVARVLKADQANGEPIHRLCAHCYDRGEKGYLNPTNDMIRRCRVHRCSSCNGEIAMGEELPNDAPAVVAEPAPAPLPVVNPRVRRAY